METTKNQDDNFIADMKNRYTHDLRDINDINSLFHKVIDGNVTWDVSHIFNDDITVHHSRRRRDTDDDQTTASVTLSHDVDGDGSNHTSSYEDQALFMTDSMSTEHDFGEIEYTGTTPYHADSHNATDNKSISDGHTTLNNHGGAPHLVHTLEEEIGHGFHLGSVAILCVLCFEASNSLFVNHHMRNCMLLKSMGSHLYTVYKTCILISLQTNPYRGMSIAW